MSRFILTYLNLVELNTCFTQFTDAVLKQNLMDFVESGKGYVGIHCSAHTFLDWPEFGQLQGAYSVDHPWHEKITAVIEEPELRRHSIRLRRLGRRCNAQTTLEDGHLRKFMKKFKMTETAPKAEQQPPNWFSKIVDRSSHMNKKLLQLAITLLAGFTPWASAEYQGFQHSGSLYLLTTPDGANLPATATAEGFPLLVRLDKGWFDFSQAKPDGADVRFATSAGASLAYQIEAWDASAGMAAIWVRIPTLKGNARQELKMFWGKADASSESDGKAIFNASNGYKYIGDMDEVRVSTRDALRRLGETSIRKPETVQTLVRTLVKEGGEFSTSAKPQGRVEHGKTEYAGLHHQRCRRRHPHRATCAQL